MMYFKYAASILMALLVCGMQHVVEARRNHRHPHHQLTRAFTPINSLLNYTENSDLLKFFTEYSAVEQSIPLEDYSQPTLAFDAKETNTTYHILCDLPGVDKKEISLSVRNNELTITAKRSIAVDEIGVTYRRIERQSGEVMTTIILPEDCEQDMIVAESKDGVLTVTIPKIMRADKEVGAVQIEVQ